MEVKLCPSIHGTIEGARMESSEECNHNSDKPGAELNVGDTAVRMFKIGVG